MNEKYRHEKHKIFEKMSDGLCEALYDSGAIIAGGFISRIFSGRSTDGADIDVYFRKPADLAKVLYAVECTGDIIFDYTDKSVMIRSGGKSEENSVVVQLIIIDYFDTPAEVFKRFDFTCVMGALDLLTDEFVFHDDFFIHNAQRKLVYNSGTQFPIISSLRVDKYKKEGYHISRTEFLKVVISLMKLNINSWDVAQKQFGKFYGTNISEFITEEMKSKPFDMDLLMQGISDYEFQPFEFTEDVNVRIGDYDGFVHRMTGQVIKTYNWNDKKIFKKYNGCWGTVPASYDEAVFDTKNSVDVTGKEFVYKYVTLESDGTLSSQYKHSFKYVVGQVAKDERTGLWFYYDEGVQLAKNAYGNVDNRVLIECKPIEFKDRGIHPDSDCRLSSVDVLRIVPREEETIMLENCKKISEDFPF